MSLVAKVEILGEFKNLTKATQGATDSMKKMDKKFAGFSRSIKGSLALIAGSMVFGQITAGIRASIDAASDFAESATAVKAVFGDATDTVNKFAESAAQNIGTSRNAALDASKTFGIFGNAAGLAAEDSATFSTDLVTLAADLASFNNTSVDEALSALGSGLRGEAEPLRKYGIMLDDAKLKAAALELGIYDGVGALSSQEKILAANKVIFDESTIAQGDFARTSDGLANSTKTATAKMEDMQAKIGTALLPIMGELVDVFVEKLLPKLEEFSEWLGTPQGADFLTGVSDGLQGIATMISDTVELFQWLGANIEHQGNMAEAFFSGDWNRLGQLMNMDVRANFDRQQNPSTVDPRSYIPQMATGGVVLPSAGGTLVNVGEAGQAEAIVPLDRLGNIGGGNSYTININKASVNGQEVVRAIMDYEKTNGRKFVS